MRYLVLAFLLLCGCDGANLFVPPDYKVETWFEDVPAERYSRPIGEYLAIEAHATMKPPGVLYWCLDVWDGDGWVENTCRTSAPGEIAGQRWYLDRSQHWRLQFRAWNSERNLFSSAEWEGP